MRAVKAANGHHLAVALMVAFIIMATILFIMFCWALFERIGAI